MVNRRTHCSKETLLQAQRVRKVECVAHRWLVAQKDPVRNGEMYRMIADTGGAFVQPALYEAFGLTVVEVSIFFKCLRDLHVHNLNVSASL